MTRVMTGVRDARVAMGLVRPARDRGGFRTRVYGGSEAWGSGNRVENSGLKVWGLRSRVSGLTFGGHIFFRDMYAIQAYPLFFTCNLKKKEKKRSHFLFSKFQLPPYASFHSVQILCPPTPGPSQHR